MFWGDPAISDHELCGLSNKHESVAFSFLFPHAYLCGNFGDYVQHPIKVLGRKSRGQKDAHRSGRRDWLSQ
jgi:hypothetical protein